MLVYIFIVLTIYSILSIDCLSSIANFATSNKKT